MRKLKTIFFLLILASTSFWGCRELKEDVLLVDELAPFIGEYAGIRVYYQPNPGGGYLLDTSDITATIQKAGFHSIIEIKIESIPSSRLWSFRYANDTFVSTTLNHPPTLSIGNGRFEIYHKPSLAPFWSRYLANKSP